MTACRVDHLFPRRGVLLKVEPGYVGNAQTFTGLGVPRTGLRPVLDANLLLQRFLLC
jgi:hypothetical protein